MGMGCIGMHYEGRLLLLPGQLAESRACGKADAKRLHTANKPRAPKQTRLLNHVTGLHQNAVLAALCPRM